MSDETLRKPLRSEARFGRQDKMGFVYRSFLRNSGSRQDQFDGRPVIKPSAASPELMRQTWRAVVFENAEEMHHAVNDESLDIDASCIMVLKNCGPKGYPSMAEVGNMPLSIKLLRQTLSFPTTRKGNTAMFPPPSLARPYAPLSPTGALI
jgi:dihydroxyacid dehydratase/phosphogluconate dehydratase